jgi:hypothetical protein
MSTTLTRDRTNSVDHWLAVCRSHARTPGIKRAEIGGDGQSAPFEQAMSNLAHAYLRDRAPQLLPYELGFQLIEKNEENDRAVGIMGFKVGAQYLYVPIFFLNGELKGHELLYLKDSDTFVPLKENWVNYVLNRKPLSLGNEVQPNLRQLGAERPNMDHFRISPSKYASVYEPWLLDGMPGLMYATSHRDRPEPKLHDMVKESAVVATKFLKWIEAQPALAKPFVECYGRELFDDAIKTASTLNTVAPVLPPKRQRTFHFGSVWEEKTAEVKPDIDIYVYEGKWPKGLTEKQAETLKRDGIYIDDRRDVDGISHAYRVETPLALQNPDCTGLFEVLCAPNDFVKCLVIDKPHGERGRRPGCVLIRADNDGEGRNKSYSQTHQANVFAIEKYADKDYADWFDALPDSTEMENGGEYVILAPNNDGTNVFEVKRKMKGVDGEDRYEVYWRGGWRQDRPDRLPPVSPRRTAYNDVLDDCDMENRDQISLNRIKGTSFLGRLETLFCPAGSKCVQVKKPDPNRVVHCIDDDNSDPPALVPGSHVDLQLGIFKMSSEMKLFNNGYEAIVNGNTMPTKAALLHLVRDHGLKEADARDMLKEASTSRGKTYRIKYAQPYPMQSGSPTAPYMPEYSPTGESFMGAQVPTHYGNGEEEEILVDDLQTTGHRPDMAAPPDPQTMMALQDAAGTGQREILDTSAMANLLEGSRDDTLIDQYLPHLVKGVDSTGRLLFNFYWHRDLYEERFGAENLRKLEDAMKNSFENSGDLALELKQKSVEPYPGEGVDVDLDAAAEA